MKKEIYLTILGIAMGEAMIFSGHTYIGLILQIINLQAITLTLIFSSIPIKNKNLLQILLLLVQMRILNLTMPPLFNTKLLWYPLVYGVMFISLYFVTNQQKITSKDMGIDYEHLHLYIPLALVIAAAMAILEFKILNPSPLVPDLRMHNVLLISIVMFIFVAAIEELIFRSILQARLQSVFGMNKGLLFGAVLFGIMHSGYGLVNEILFATFFGVVLGYIFQKTGNFFFILMIHGTANVFLFGILPIISA